MHPSMSTPIQRRQRGVVLVVGLLLLLVMTVLGVTTIKSTILEEKMAGNLRDKDLAFQAAEAALRDGERLVRCNNCALDINGLTGLNMDCSSSGLCVANGELDPVADLRSGAGLEYGVYTGATALPDDYSSSPRYVVEGIRYWPPGAPGWKVVYRITAIGHGGTSQATAVHQSVYKP